MIEYFYHNILSTNRIGRIFDNTVATYKYFCFLSIMQIHAKTGNLNINVWDIVTRMVANAWYPIHYFRLSFGKTDSLYDIVTQLHKEINNPVFISILILTGMIFCIVITMFCWILFSGTLLYFFKHEIRMFQLYPISCFSCAHSYYTKI